MTVRDLAKRYGRIARKNRLSKSQRFLTVVHAQDLEFVLRQDGEDTYWLRRYLHAVAKTAL